MREPLRRVRGRGPTRRGGRGKEEKVSRRRRSSTEARRAATAARKKKAAKHNDPPTTPPSKDADGSPLPPRSPTPSSPTGTAPRSSSSAPPSTRRRSTSGPPGCVLAELLLRRPWLPGSSDLSQLGLIFNALGTPPRGGWPGAAAALPGYVDFAPRPRPASLAPLFPRRDPRRRARPAGQDGGARPAGSG